MPKPTPRSIALFVLPGLIGATIGATAYRVALGDWDAIGWVAAVLMAGTFCFGNVIINRPL